MHKEAMEAMQNMVNPIVGDGFEVLDVGSFNVNGSYRHLIESRGWKYVGLDLRPGDNVDIVAGDPYKYPFPDDRFDLVISGSTMEHVERPWLWVPEIVRVLKPDSWLCLITHWRFGHHPFPLDCWRILPDGMKAIFDDTGVLTDYEIRMINDSDIIGKARKIEG